MADLSTIRTRVRRRVSDASTTEIYRDGYYNDAIDNATNKLSLDLGEDYPTVEVVPPKLSHLVVLLAAIEMCYVRAADEITGSQEGVLPSDNEDLSVSSISVPNLTVSSQAPVPDTERKGWMELAASLQEEYDETLKKIECDFNSRAVSQGTVGRVSTRTGGYAKFKLDRGLPAVSGLSVVVDIDGVHLAWSPIYDETFNVYVIMRSVSPSMANSVRVATLSDNHKSKHLDRGLVPGFYYYRVDVQNMNSIKTEGTVAAIRVV